MNSDFIQSAILQSVYTNHIQCCKNIDKGVSGMPWGIIRENVHSEGIRTCNELMKKQLELYMFGIKPTENEKQKKPE